MTVTKYNIAVVGLIVGLTLDLLLNFSVQKRIINAGLTNYFTLHGTFESAFIAGGLVSLTIFIAYSLWEELSLFINYNNNSNYYYYYSLIYLTIFGFIIDTIFRFTHLMPSLNCMFNSLNIIQSMFFTSLSLVISYAIAYEIFNK